MDIYLKYLLRSSFKGEAYIRTLLGNLEEDEIIIHSVNLPKYENKRLGEIDFQIITKQRVIALERWADQFQLEHTGQAPTE